MSQRGRGRTGWSRLLSCFGSSFERSAPYGAFDDPADQMEGGRGGTPVRKQFQPSPCLVQSDVTLISFEKVGCQAPVPTTPTGVFNRADNLRKRISHRACAPPNTPTHLAPDIRDQSVPLISASVDSDAHPRSYESCSKNASSEDIEVGAGKILGCGDRGCPKGHSTPRVGSLAHLHKRLDESSIHPAPGDLPVGGFDVSSPSDGAGFDFSMAIALAAQRVREVPVDPCRIVSHLRAISPENEVGKICVCAPIEGKDSEKYGAEVGEEANPNGPHFAPPMESISLGVSGIEKESGQSLVLPGEELWKTPKSAAGFLSSVGGAPQKRHSSALVAERTPKRSHSQDEETEDEIYASVVSITREMVDVVSTLHDMLDIVCCRGSDRERDALGDDTTIAAEYVLEGGHTVREFGGRAEVLETRDACSVNTDGYTDSLLYNASGDLLSDGSAFSDRAPLDASLYTFAPTPTVSPLPLDHCAVSARRIPLVPTLVDTVENDGLLITTAKARVTLKTESTQDASRLSITSGDSECSELAAFVRSPPPVLFDCSMDDSSVFLPPSPFIRPSGPVPPFSRGVDSPVISPIVSQPNMICTEPPPFDKSFSARTDVGEKQENDDGSADASEERLMRVPTWIGISPLGRRRRGQ